MKLPSLLLDRSAFKRAIEIAKAYTLSCPDHLENPKPKTKAPVRLKFSKIGLIIEASHPRYGWMKSVIPVTGSQPVEWSGMWDAKELVELKLGRGKVVELVYCLPTLSFQRPPAPVWQMYDRCLNIGVPPVLIVGGAEVSAIHYGQEPVPSRPRKAFPVRDGMIVLEASRKLLKPGRPIQVDWHGQTWLNKAELRQLSQHPDSRILDMESTKVVA
jgi:hypothetical protein